MKYGLEKLSDLLVTHTGMALVEALMAKTDLKKRLNRAALPNVFDPSITHADVIRSYIGLLWWEPLERDHFGRVRKPTEHHRCYIKALCQVIAPSRY